jgi:branched-chain amino acid transport system ATP-binding protein/branched-chain amino acid transport system permease protein
MTRAGSQLYGRRRPWFVLPLAATALMLLLPQAGLDRFWTREIVLIATFMLATSGLNLSFGFAGELALGHAAIYAGGAYMAAVVATRYSDDILVGLAAAALVAVVLGVATGIPGLRIGGWGLAVVSFFLVLLIPSITTIFGGVLGGPVGLSMPLPTLLGTDVDATALYRITIIVVALWFAVFRNLVVGRFGVAFRTLRESPTLAASLGVSVYRTKLLAYTLGAIPAGIAGALFAHTDSYISPSSFTLATTIGLLAASILGGSASVYGPILGAIIIKQGPLQAASFREYSLVVYGIILLVGGVLLSGGIAGLLRRITDRWDSAETSPSDRSTVHDFPPLHGATLEVRGVHKSFGGNRALVDVSMMALPGRVTAIIGPNGSGKTTLLNALSRIYDIDAGSMLLDGATIDTQSVADVARSGVARTFQTPMVPKEMSALDVVASGRLGANHCSTASAVLRLPRYRRVQREDADIAAETLEMLGLGSVAAEAASTLPLGTRRMIEVGRALAARARVVLLDEPAAGMDDDEIDHLGDVIRRLAAAGATVIVVEHNVQLVMDIADDVHVLAQGRIIASGDPAFVQAHPDVIAHYLGGALTDVATIEVDRE